ncbi:MAG: ABC transporter permease [Candidatus Krumholzibacteria bacterium]|nr:ABC transporter permease [Candidatus Krumholzibacteria bacterium]
MARDAATMTRGLRRRLSGYGMLGVLLLLCALFSALTLRDQQRTGAAAARELARALAARADTGAAVLVLARDNAEERAFLADLATRLRDAGFTRVRSVAAGPPEFRAACEEQAAADGPRFLLTLQTNLPAVRVIQNSLPEHARPAILSPAPYRWPTFLLADNLRNVANQIAVIAIVAVGMTLVIITAGIDLSVGSLIALSAVVCAWLVQAFGGQAAGAGALLAAAAGAMLLCGLAGLFSGAMVVRFRLPPFIATLAMMQVASGAAYIIAKGRPIYDAPDAFTALGRGADPLLGLPWAVWLMLLLYGLAHGLMSRTALGRYVYAVGGNREAARLAGVRTGAVLLFVYALCGVLAGLGGVVTASQLKSGAPTYGLMYELYVIAAVVVGGTSLAGGEGRVLGTLIGAFIIAVIQNGMNLTNVESYTQKVVLGLVILGAVLLDRLRSRSN